MKKTLKFLGRYILPYLLLGVIFWNLYINLRPEITYEYWMETWLKEHSAEMLYEYPESTRLRYMLVQEEDETFRFMMIAPKATFFGKVYDYKIQSELEIDMDRHYYKLQNTALSKPDNREEGSIEETSILGEMLVSDDNRNSILSFGVQYLNGTSENNIGLLISTMNTIYYYPYNDNYAFKINVRDVSKEESKSFSEDWIKLLHRMN